MRPRRVEGKSHLMSQLRKYGLRVRKTRATPRGEVDTSLLDRSCDGNLGGEACETRPQSVQSSGGTEMRPVENDNSGGGEAEVAGPSPAVGTDYQNVVSSIASEEELPSSPKYLGKKSRKKRTRNRSTLNPSPSSTSESSAEANLEGPCGSSSGGGGAPSMSPFSSGVRNRDVGHAENSDDTLTNVSSLSSLGCLSELNLSADEEGLLGGQPEVPALHRSGEHHDLDEYSLSSESQHGNDPDLLYAVGSDKRNYSFSNDEVRTIDQENHRLLRELSRQSADNRPRSVPGMKTCVYSFVPIAQLSHSGVNRERENRRIEKANRVQLKRLEAVKPTPGLKRSSQLADHLRFAGYVAPPSICMPVINTGSRTPSGPRSISSASRTSRGVSINACSSRTSRSRELSAARPAWS